MMDEVTDVAGTCAGPLWALELALAAVPGLEVPKLADTAAGLPTSCGVAELARHVSHMPGVATRTGTWSPRELVDAASSGAAFIVETPSGWAVVSGGRGRRAQVVTQGPSGDKHRLVTARGLTRIVGTQTPHALLLEPEYGLESLSKRVSKSKSPWPRLWALLALEGTDLAALAVYAIVLGGLSLAVPVAVQVLVNTIALGSLLQPLVVLSALLLGVLGFSGLIQVLQAYAVELVQRRVFVRVAEDFARRLPSFKFSTHDKIHAPELTNRFFEIVGLQKSLSKLLIDGLSLALQTLVGMLLLAFYHPVLLAFDAALTISLLLVVGLGYGAVTGAINESNAKYRVAAWLQQVAAQPTVFSRDAGSVMATVRADALTRDYLGARRSHYAILLRQLVGGVGIQVMAMAGLLGLGGWLVMEGELTLGQLVAAELVVGVIGVGFAKSGKYFESGYDLLASLDKLGKIIDQPLAAHGLDTPPSSDAFSVELLGVRVGRSDGPPSATINSQIAAGSSVALTGRGGAGKSSLLESLAGLREPVAGRILIGSADYHRDLGPAEAREGSWLLRPDAMVEGTVLDNLRLGDLDLDEARAWDLLRTVGLYEQISALDGGLHAPIGPTGGPLSTSGIARLSIARAMAAKPRLLLVDNALDRLGLSNEHQGELLDRIVGPSAPWTAVVVTGCQAVLDRCDHNISLDSDQPQEAA